MKVVRLWLDKVPSPTDIDVLECGDHEREDAMKLVESAAFLLSRMSTHKMNTTGELNEMSALNAVCEELKRIVAATANHSLYDLALATKCLSIIGSNATAVDSLPAFENERILPLLLALTRVWRYSGKLDAKCAIGLATNKWVLHCNVMRSSSFIDTKLLKTTYDACVEALPTAGMDPLALSQMVNVLSLTLSQLASPLANCPNVIEQLDGLFEGIWMAYTDSKAKPDSLTRAVITCTWRAQPASALSFADELVELLLYKEPVIDEKEQLSPDTCTPFQWFQGSIPISYSNAKTAAIESHAKDRFVRLVVLNFLADVVVDGSAFTTDTQNLMDALFFRLIELNVTPEWQKQHMLNSNGFGAAFAVPQLPSVRYYMELFGMRMAIKYSREICSGLLLPMLCDSNLMPQVGASVLIVSAYLVRHKLDDIDLDVDYGELLETMLPWLNSSHGHTRVLTQYLLAKVLPRHIHQLQYSSGNTPGLRFLEGTVRYLSNNKECKRMMRRQARQLEDFRPDYESSLLGMLCSGFINEFGELLPRDEPSVSDSALPTAMRANFDAAQRGGTLNARQRLRQPIFMCASLVDKIPNLAGLARTCEIFNAQKLIVPNLRATEQDVTFATVSATAHKWMPLEEVRPQGDDLREALLRWKSEGYTIVAVEQTGSSVSLAKYMLPRKMVLVLGREKEGISVDILQLVDVCVEIPQFGLVRSLNVHADNDEMLKCGAVTNATQDKQLCFCGALSKSGAPRQRVQEKGHWTSYASSISMNCFITQLRQHI
ncbi:unnamed protein product [Peronospora belbahrii]|uniref:tRNA/rRNA methyltransferase SpoU type domain-containing protein n=1 Tax=Peronospora belbahrii TaxID=622444 RepID=A0ABN8CNL7_9STRA|nr:unnamed protein product [Peronospora belbahrii]